MGRQGALWPRRCRDGRRGAAAATRPLYPLGQPPPQLLPVLFLLFYYTAVRRYAQDVVSPLHDSFARVLTAAFMAIDVLNRPRVPLFCGHRLAFSTLNGQGICLLHRGLGAGRSDVASCPLDVVEIVLGLHAPLGLHAHASEPAVILHSDNVTTTRAAERRESLGGRKGG